MCFFKSPSFNVPTPATPPVTTFSDSAPPTAMEAAKDGTDKLKDYGRTGKRGMRNNLNLQLIPPNQNLANVGIGGVNSTPMKGRF